MSTAGVTTEYSVGASNHAYLGPQSGLGATLFYPTVGPSFIKVYGIIIGRGFPEDLITFFSLRIFSLRNFAVLG